MKINNCLECPYHSLDMFSNVVWCNEDHTVPYQYAKDPSLSLPVECPKIGTSMEWTKDDSK